MCKFSLCNYCPLAVCEITGEYCYTQVDPTFLTRARQQYIKDRNRHRIRTSVVVTVLVTGEVRRPRKSVILKRK